jgi:hydroxyacylglutathione hydrolase
VSEEITPSGLEAALGEGAQLVDTRSKEAHRTEHLSAAISIPGESSFATRAGWFVSPEKPIVLIAERNRIEGLVRALIRVGLDRVIGFVPAEALASYRSLGLASNEPVDVAEAHRQWERGAAVLDVRSTAEYRQGHIPGAIHVPAQRLLLSLENVPRDRPLFVHCAGGGRSNVASSVLRNVGFHDVADVEGGFSAWEAAGYAVESEEPIAAP